MAQPEQSKTRSWLPLTPRGVATFARSSWWRLLLVQFIFAVLVAGAVVWLLDTAWFPTSQKAIRQLPARGEITSGRVTAFTNAPQLLAEGPFLAVVLDLNHSGQIRSTAHVQVEFGRSDVRVISLFGYAVHAYPVG